MLCVLTFLKENCNLADIIANNTLTDDEINANNTTTVPKSRIMALFIFKVATNKPNENTAT